MDAATLTSTVLGAIQAAAERRRQQTDAILEHTRDSLEAHVRAAVADRNRATVDTHLGTAIQNVIQTHARVSVLLLDRQRKLVQDIQRRKRLGQPMPTDMDPGVIDLLLQETPAFDIDPLADHPLRDENESAAFSSISPRHNHYGNRYNPYSRPMFSSPSMSISTHSIYPNLPTVSALPHEFSFPSEMSIHLPFMSQFFSSSDGQSDHDSVLADSLHTTDLPRNQQTKTEIRVGAPTTRSTKANSQAQKTGTTLSAISSSSTPSSVTSSSTTPSNSTTTVPITKAEEKQGMCIICFVEPAEMVFDPCGHLVTCIKCVEEQGKTRTTHKYINCSVCRAKVKQAFRVFK